MSFTPVWYHRFKYFLSPQLDLYQNIKGKYFTARKVLDYGCGTGFGTIQMVESSVVTGIDSDPNAILAAQDILGKICEFGIADWSLSDFAVAPDFYDLITCIEVIEHVKHADVLVRNLSLCLKPEGTLAISTLNHNSQYRKHNDHIGRYTIESFKSFLEPFLPGVIICDYRLNQIFSMESNITPIVAIWRKRIATMGEKV